MLLPSGGRWRTGHASQIRRASEDAERDLGLFPADDCRLILEAKWCLNAVESTESKVHSPETIRPQTMSECLVC